METLRSYDIVIGLNEGEIHTATPYIGGVQLFEVEYIVGLKTD